MKGFKRSFLEHLNDQACKLKENSIGLISIKFIRKKKFKSFNALKNVKKRGRQKKIIKGVFKF